MHTLRILYLWSALNFQNWSKLRNSSYKYEANLGKRLQDGCPDVDTLSEDVRERNLNIFGTFHLQYSASLTLKNTLFSFSEYVVVGEFLKKPQVCFWWSLYQNFNISRIHSRSQSGLEAELAQQLPAGIQLSGSWSGQPFSLCVSFFTVL